MSISFKCDCGKRLRVDDNYAGRRVRCQSCNAVVEVPQLEDTGSEPLIDAAPPPRPDAVGQSRPAPKLSNAKLMGWLVASMGILFGFIFCMISLQNYGLYAATRLPPKTMRVADLIRSGPGEHRYIMLTDFVIGPGFAYESLNNNRENWARVFLAVFPAGEPVPAPQIKTVLESDAVHNQRQLDELKQRRTIPGVVSSSQRSNWGMTLGDMLRNGNNAKLDSAWDITAVDSPPSGVAIASQGVIGGVLSSWAWSPVQS